MIYYLIKIMENTTIKYLFNTRILVEDPALAKPFSSPALAKRYLKKSAFSNCEFIIIPIVTKEPTTYHHSLGSIVE